MAKSIIVFSALAQKDEDKPEILAYSFLVDDMDDVKEISWSWWKTKEKEGYQLVGENDSDSVTLLWLLIDPEMVKEAAADG